MELLNANTRHPSKMGATNKANIYSAQDLHKWELFSPLSIFCHKFPLNFISLTREISEFYQHLHFFRSSSTYKPLADRPNKVSFFKPKSICFFFSKDCHQSQFILADHNNQAWPLIITMIIIDWWPRTSQWAAGPRNDSHKVCPISSPLSWLSTSSWLTT